MADSTSHPLQIFFAEPNLEAEAYVRVHVVLKLN